MTLSESAGPRAPGAAAILGETTAPGRAATAGGERPGLGSTASGEGPGLGSTAGGEGPGLGSTAGREGPALAATAGRERAGLAATVGGERAGLASRLRRRVSATWGELAPGWGLTAAVRAELALEGGERVLSMGEDRGGECVLVATDRAVYHRLPARGSTGGSGESAGGGAAGGGNAGGGPAGGWSRLGWEQVAQVGWDAAGGRLIVIGVSCPVGDASASSGGGGPAGAASPRVVVPLRQRGGVPELAAERIAYTRLGQWQLHVGGRRRAVIEARRRPGTGELLWSVTPDADGQCNPERGNPERGNPERGNPERGDLDIGAHAARAIARLSAEFGALPQPGTGPSLL